MPGYGDETAVFENPFVTKQHLSKGESFIITSYHFIGPYNRCETILSFLPKCQICLPMQILLIISHNSPSTNQANTDEVGHDVTVIVCCGAPTITVHFSIGHRSNKP